GIARTVFVVLHGHESDLGWTVQTWDDKALWVGLLQVVERAVRDVLTQLPHLPMATQVVGEAERVDVLDKERLEFTVHVRARGNVVSKRVDEGFFQLGTERQQRRVPLEVGVDPLESTVVGL